MTIAAFTVTLVGAFTLPRLPSPASYTVLLPPVILIVSIIYEGGSLPRLTVSSRLRLALALWQGLRALVLMAGIVLSRSTASGLFAPIATFFVRGMAGELPLWVVPSRQIHETPTPRG